MLYGPFAHQSLQGLAESSDGRRRAEPAQVGARPVPEISNLRFANLGSAKDIVWARQPATSVEHSG